MSSCQYFDVSCSRLQRIWNAGNRKFILNYNSFIGFILIIFRDTNEFNIESKIFKDNFCVMEMNEQISKVSFIIFVCQIIIQSFILSKYRKIRFLEAISWFQAFYCEWNLKIICQSWTVDRYFFKKYIIIADLNTFHLLWGASIYGL